MGVVEEGGKRGGGGDGRRGRRGGGGWEGEEEAVLSMSVLMIGNSFLPPSVGLEDLSRPTPWS